VFQVVYKHVSIIE